MSASTSPPPPGRPGRGARSAKAGGATTDSGLGLVEAAPEPVRAKEAGRPTTASSYVAATIRDGILRGSFPLGSRLDQQVLAERLGVSIIPIREGLRALEAEGLVQIMPRRGAYVAELSVPELAEIGWIRERLEELAVRLAVPKITPATLARLQRLNDRMRRLAATARPEQWFEMNRQWHFMVYDSARTWLLVDMISTLWDRSRLYRMNRMAREENRARAVEEHDDVLRHLRSGEPYAAARSIRYHIRTAARENLGVRAALRNETGHTNDGSPGGADRARD